MMPHSRRLRTPTRRSTGYGHRATRPDRRSGRESSTFRTSHEGASPLRSPRQLPSFVSSEAAINFLTCRASPRTVTFVRAELLGMRIIPEMRVGKAAHDVRPPGLESAEVALRDRGFRLTVPRRVVLEVVRGIKTHPTAEEVHRLVSRRAPRVSLGTVYRNLRLLVDAGLLGELPGPRARFDGNTRAHHHFTCLRCGRIADVEAPVAEPHSRALSKRVAARTGHTITHHRIDFFGRCRECRRRGAVGRADVVRRRMPVLAPRILPGGERQEACYRMVERAQRISQARKDRGRHV